MRGPAWDRVGRHQDPAAHAAPVASLGDQWDEVAERKRVAARGAHAAAAAQPVAAHRARGGGGKRRGADVRRAARHAGDQQPADLRDVGARAVRGPLALAQSVRAGGGARLDVAAPVARDRARRAGRQAVRRGAHAQAARGSDLRSVRRACCRASTCPPSRCVSPARQPMAAAAESARARRARRAARQPPPLRAAAARLRWSCAEAIARLFFGGELPQRVVCLETGRLQLELQLSEYAHHGDISYLIRFEALEPHRRFRPPLGQRPASRAARGGGTWGRRCCGRCSRRARVHVGGAGAARRQRRAFVHLYKLLPQRQGPDRRGARLAAPGVRRPLGAGRSSSSSSRRRSWWASPSRSRAASPSLPAPPVERVQRGGPRACGRAIEQQRAALADLLEGADDANDGASERLFDARRCFGARRAVHVEEFSRTSSRPTTTPAAAAGRRARPQAARRRAARRRLQRRPQRGRPPRRLPRRLSGVGQLNLDRAGGRAARRRRCRSSHPRPAPTGRRRCSARRPSRSGAARAWRCRSASTRARRLRRRGCC